MSEVRLSEVDGNGSANGGDISGGNTRRFERCKQTGVPVLSSMGAANKMDPTAFRVADISRTSVCPLARIVRIQCRKRKIDKLKVVFSTEPPLAPLPQEDGEQAAPGRRTVPASNAFVPAACGLVMGGEAVKDLLRMAGTLRPDV